MRFVRKARYYIAIIFDQRIFVDLYVHMITCFMHAHEFLYMYAGMHPNHNYVARP